MSPTPNTEEIAMNRPRLRRSNGTVITLATIGIGLVASQALAWSRAFYEDAQVVERSELIVVGRLDRDSIKFVSHARQPGDGASDEHHATLLVTEVLKGKLADKEIPIIIYYGLTPVVGGLLNQGNMYLDLRSRERAYPKDVIEIIDTGSSVHGHSLVKNAGADAIWFLRRRSGIYGREPGTGRYGIVDPEDLQPLSLKGYFASYLGNDPEPALRRQMAANPEVAARAMRYLDHLDVQRASKRPDPMERAKALIPYFLKGTSWGMTYEARDGLLTCGDAAGPLLVPYFQAQEHAPRRQDIIMLWGEIGWRDCVEPLIDVLKEHDEFWAKQDLPQGWWNKDVESTLTQRRREVYGAVYKSVITLGNIGDPRARDTIEATRRRWLEIRPNNMQIVDACDQALKNLAKRGGK